MRLETGLREDLEAALEASVAFARAARDSRPPRIVAIQPVSGGSIHDARRLDLADGRRVFAKIALDPDDDSRQRSEHQVFAREAAGLEALAAARAVRTPEVLAVEPCSPRTGAAFLLLEFIDTGLIDTGLIDTGLIDTGLIDTGPIHTGPPARGGSGDGQAQLGRGLAELHRREPSALPFSSPVHEGAGQEGAGPTGPWGFAHDNFLGSTPQENGWLPSWTEFWRRRRLQALLDRLRRSGRSDAQLDRLADRLLDRLGEWLDPVDEPPSLLHGDLWGGNVLYDAAGAPVLVDPATYVGHREADLAMTRLFGGFGPRFYRAYDESWPPLDGHLERRPLYELHHMLNHLLLFGDGYRHGCLERLRRLVG